MENTEPKKRGPKNSDSFQEVILSLQERIENLENLVARLAHVEGRSKYVLEYGLKPYKPEQK